MKTFFDEYGGEKKSMKRLVAFMFALTINLCGITLCITFALKEAGEQTLLFFAGESIVALLTILGFNTAKYKFYKDAQAPKQPS